MKNSFTGILFRVLLLSLCLTALFSLPAFAESYYSASSLNTQEQNLISQIQQDRMRYQLSMPEVDSSLNRLARMKADDMRDNGYFSHISPTYGNVRTMLVTYSYPFSAAAENIAHNRSVSHAEAAFLSSPGHRKTLLSTAWTHMGVGVSVTPQGYVYVCQIFVKK